MSSPTPLSAASSEALRDDVLQRIASQGDLRRYGPHTILISEGDVSDTLFIILAGRVKVYASNAAGKEITLITHGPGEYVGELMLYGGARSASVMTLEPTTCSVVTGATLRGFVENHPDFAFHLIRKLIGRVRQATDSVKSLALQDVYGRVVRLLDELAVPQGADLRIDERLTQQQIAERVGSSREMVSRIFKDLTVGGYVEVVGGRITIKKRLPAAW